MNMFSRKNIISILVIILFLLSYSTNYINSVIICSISIVVYIISMLLLFKNDIKIYLKLLYIISSTILLLNILFINPEYMS